MKRKFLSFLAAGMLFTLPAAAQSVGVVMSGGGAKGLYHIGVLQALEESGIPIDYVSGTSMGSIIAGMYAAGYSPEEMRRIVASGVVKQWVSGRIDPSYLPYYRRNTGTPIFLSIRLNMKDRPDDPNASRFRLPSYLISSNQIDLALADLFGPATTASRRDFDSLMVPFLCVASDMNTRRPVVLRKGDMGEAIRSSMSIPLAFKPMKIDTMLLYDGGIYDNFPWEPLDKEFHPDFLIGSKCTSGNNDITENSSLVDQAFSLAMNKTNYDMPEGRSLMINRAVNVSMLDFNSADSIIEAGYRDALAQIPALREKIHRIVTPEEIRTKRAAFREKCPPIIFDDYEFEGLTHAQTAYVRDVMRLDDTYDGRQRQMSFPEFRDDFFSVIGNDEFSVEYPEFRYDPLRERYSVKLKMSARENLRFLIGGNISSTAFNQAFIGFDYHTIRRVSQWAFAGIYIGPTYATGSLGGRTDFYLWKPFSLDYSYNFEVLNLRHGNFGNLTPIDNTKSVKNNQGFLSIGLTTAWHRCGSTEDNKPTATTPPFPVRIPTPTSRASPSSAPSWRSPATRSTRFSTRAGGPKYPSRASTSRGANDTNPPNSGVSEVSTPTANGSAPNSSGTAISTCPAANGSRSDSTSTPSGPRTPGSRPKRLH